MELLAGSRQPPVERMAVHFADGELLCGRMERIQKNVVGFRHNYTRNVQQRAAARDQPLVP